MSIKADVMIRNAIKRINREETLIRSIINYQYYLINYYLSFLCILFCKRYIVTKIIFYQLENGSKRSYISDSKKTLFLYDKGFCINDLLIPYENVLEFGMNNGFLVVDVFAKIVHENQKINMFLDNSIIKLAIEMENPKNFMENMKSNMYYHIKYNKINKEILQYYV